MAKQKTSKKKTSTSPIAKQVSAVTTSPAVGKNPNDKLRVWNIRLAVLLVLQAAAVVFFGKATSHPVTTQYLATDTLATEANGHQVLALANRHLFDVSIVWVVAAFLLLLAAVHVVVATVYRTRYEAALKRGVSELRWIGMALVGGAVVITIALLSGIASLSSLAMLLALMVAGCLLIFPAEVLHIERPKGMLSHVVCGVGTMAILAPLAIFAIGICGSLMYDGTIPAYLYGVYATAAVAVGLGIFITHFRMLRRGKLVDSYYTEGVYMVLGFLAVSALAWQIFVGIL